ncbi:hypothetical protein HNY73_010802 [Argiope bruennichi]|uniref:Uncharacterized protein n=1 Tax=Argiope bruennichi TaxID=94029 RepID=A0A8T0F731_ARGBR|nr:hypothetical protein HNY73_010802 [Argiope bruennichi]
MMVSGVSIPLVQLVSGFTLSAQFIVEVTGFGPSMWYEVIPFEAISTLGSNSFGRCSLHSRHVPSKVNICSPQAGQIILSMLYCEELILRSSSVTIRAQ